MSKVGHVRVRWGQMGSGRVGWVRVGSSQVGIISNSNRNQDAVFLLIYLISGNGKSTNDSILSCVDG